MICIIYDRLTMICMTKWKKTRLSQISKLLCLMLNAKFYRLAQTFFTSYLVINYFLFDAYASLINQLSSTDLVESNMANIGRKLKLVGYWKPIVFFYGFLSNGKIRAHLIYIMHEHNPLYIPIETKKYFKLTA